MRKKNYVKIGSIRVVKHKSNWEWDRNDKESLMIYYVVVLCHYSYCVLKNRNA